MDRNGHPFFDKQASNITLPPRGFGLILTILATRIATLGLYPLYDPSESRYAEMARKMLETENWVMPMIDYGVPFWGKPPLTIWLTALSLEIGGTNDFAARMPSVFLGIGIVWILFYLAKSQRGTDNALSAILMLASSVLFFVMSGTVAMDQCLSFGITLALSSFWLALRKDKPFWGYVFFIGLSIGVMAKGLIAIVLSGITIGLWTAISWRWLDVWKRIPWISGSLLMLCVCVPWYLIAERHTPGFLEYFFIGEHWKRFTESGWNGDLYGVGHEHTRGLIWVYWLAAGFPWSLILLKKLASALARKEGGQFLQSNDGWRLYCLLWMVSPLLFFTFSANIIWTYVLPGLPGLALLVADLQGQSKKFRSMLALCVPISFVGLVMVYQLPDADFFKSQKRLVDAYRQLASPTEKLIYLKERPISAQFYLHGKSLELSGVEALKNSLDSSGHHFYVIRNEVVDTLSESVKVRLEPVKSYGQFMLFHARAGNEG
jgi:4-amino-4-deoxy-L-arabinose transferase-like glycosyltransferase